jgi:uncharacterized protein
MRRLTTVVLVLWATACTSPTTSSNVSPSVTTPTPAPNPGAPPLRVLMLTATAGFRHDSIPTARDTMTALGAATGEFAITATENVPDLTATRLASFDILMFGLTSGELPFDPLQKAAIADFVNRGGGFIGVHSASDTLYEWPDYGRLVGAYFKEHPWTQDGAVLVEDRDDPSTAGLGASFRLFDEFYTFRVNPRPTVHVLLALDPNSVGATGDFPLAWSQTIGAGRSYYNALGHFQSTWTDARFQRQMLGAIRWVGKRQ